MKTPPYPNQPSVLQYWFPLLLGFLLFLCVPGAILLEVALLAIFGRPTTGRVLEEIAQGVE